MLIPARLTTYMTLRHLEQRRLMRIVSWVATAAQRFEQSAKLDKTRVEKLKSLGYAR